MGTKNRWRAWLGCYALIVVTFGLAWWNNPANVGDVNEAQRVWLAFGFSVMGMLVFIPPLALRTSQEFVAQRTLIVCLAIFMAVALWWTAYLPSDPFGCSRVNDPDCHTNTATRWRALAEVSGAWLLAFFATHAVGGLIERKRQPRAVGSAR